MKIFHCRQQMEAGDMVKSITDLADGYKIAFASGKTVEVSGIAGETGTEVTQIRSIVDNEEKGTGTITLNDVANTQYTFRKTSTATMLVELVVDVVDIATVSCTAETPITTAATVVLVLKADGSEVSSSPCSNSEHAKNYHGHRHIWRRNNLSGRLGNGNRQLG